MKNCGGSFLAFIAGISVGVGAAIFFQSEKGREIRGAVAEYLEEKGIKLDKEQFEKLVENVTNSLKSLTSRFSKKEIE